MPVIVRQDGETLLLITQPDHAVLAAQIVAAIRTEPAVDRPRRELVLLATREHDNGWQEVDAAPTVTPAGRPCAFVEGPLAVKQDLWPRGIARAAAASPRAGALVAEHALTVYGYRRHDAEWLPFFTAISALRDALLREADIATPEELARFREDYRVVRLGDSLSLQFCNGWREAQDTLGYRAWLDGDSLRIAPDPFAGATVPLAIAARRIANRRYADDGDLRQVVASAPLEMLRGQAVGASAPDSGGR